MAEVKLNNVSEMFDAEVKGTESNTYISVSKKYRGKKAKVLVLEDCKNGVSEL
jgi:hypothetical protein